MIYLFRTTHRHTFAARNFPKNTYRPGHTTPYPPFYVGPSDFYVYVSTKRFGGETGTESLLFSRRFFKSPMIARNVGRSSEFLAQHRVATSTMKVGVPMGNSSRCPPNTAHMISTGLYSPADAPSSRPPTPPLRSCTHRSPRYFLCCSARGSDKPFV